MASADEIHKTLEALKNKKARLEGQRDQIIQECKSLGFDNPAELKAEIEKLEAFLAEKEPEYVAAYAAFTEQYGSVLATL